MVHEAAELVVHEAAELAVHEAAELVVHKATELVVHGAAGSNHIVGPITDEQQHATAKQGDLLTQLTQQLLHKEQAIVAAGLLAQDQNKAMQDLQQLGTKIEH